MRILGGMGMSVFDQDMAIEQLRNRRGVLSIPEGVTELSRDFALVFDWIPEKMCQCSFREIRIPNTVQKINGMILTEYGPDQASVKRFKKITVAKDNPYYTDIDGVLFTKDLKRLICYPCGKAGQTYIVPDTVEIIDEYAFADNTNLRKVVLPSSLKRIEFRAFFQCEKLAIINLPENLEYIGEGCFELSFEINRLIIPMSMKSIPTSLFSDGGIISVPNNSIELEYDYVPTEYLNMPFNGPAIISIDNEEIVDFAESYDYNHFENCYEDKNGIIWGNHGRTLISFSTDWGDEEYELPDEVEEVYIDAFRGSVVKRFYSKHNVAIIGKTIDTYRNYMPTKGKHFYISANTIFCDDEMNTPANKKASDIHVKSEMSLKTSAGSADINKENYVFISYSSKNQQMADSVRLLLKENSISCWMAPYDIPAGSRYAYVINDALEKCSCLLLLLTNASQMSQFVEREIERAITYKKPILPMQLEDLELNSGFKFYIGNSQIIAVPEICADAPEFLRILAGIKQFLGCEVKESIEQTKVVVRSEEKKTCQVTVFSPVNVDVYLGDKDHFVLHLDRNNGFDYERNSIIVGKKFSLIFSGKSFEKKIVFERPDNCKFEYRLDSILTEEEIISSYDREDAIGKIKKDAMGYSFDQLAVVGEKEDISLLHEWLSKKSLGVAAEDSHRNYLIAKCSVALGKLCIKYRSFEYAVDISNVYDKYKAKKSYGYYFENILKILSTVMNEAFIQEHLELFQEAEDGDPVAQYSLGEAYADKKSVFKNHEKAFEWFLKSAENGHVKGMLRVAALYYVGLGCGGKDTYKEQYWYRQAMEAGSPIAILKLAEALDRGYVDHERIGKTESEQQEALQLYEKASKLGYVEASKALAFYYQRNNRDSYLSSYWFRVGAEQGDAESQLYYAKALFYGDGEGGCKSQKEEAVIWYRKSAEQGDRLAQYALSKCLFYGEGIEKNEHEAFEWCEKAAKQGLKWAQETLSIMYSRGNGTDYDSNKCEYWYRMANQLESADSYKKAFFTHLKTMTDAYPVFSQEFDW